MKQLRTADAGFLIDGTDVEVEIKGVVFEYDWETGSGVDLEGAHACAEALGKRDGQHNGKMLTLLWTTSSATVNIEKGV